MADDRRSQPSMPSISQTSGGDHLTLTHYMQWSPETRDKPSSRPLACNQRQIMHESSSLSQRVKRHKVKPREVEQE
ncbi:hypothetical protein C1H46_045370 [Malus baccata]|uniref:Uncharacterized protein n=1 Tax=Malus baccata TaxID=106549 RepID=A0A540K4E6_MALBA|nr:hypothetical protein C1H46_045370 [Malus baccata]